LAQSPPQLSALPEASDLGSGKCDNFGAISELRRAKAVIARAFDRYTTLPCSLSPFLPCTR
ncbi:MAG: hypothetical protein ACE5PV_20230, partial [Candidatus Poribacteria bacterium]